MRKPRGRLILTGVLLASMLGSIAQTANADPITIPGYTVTDLGSGTPTFSTGANGNGILNAPNGQLFAFQQPSETFLEQGIRPAFLCSARLPFHPIPVPPMSISQTR